MPRGKYVKGVYIPVQNKPKKCPICQEKFEPHRINRVVCYKTECETAHNRELWRKSIKKRKSKEKKEIKEQAQKPLPLRRPFTADSRRMILEDIRKGRSFEWMGRMYGRDAEHIREEVGRWQARL